ncbi:MAG: hypothetical protein WCK28_19675 [Burkholderiales bacterium]|jgi:hypothetical protein
MALPDLTLALFSFFSLLRLVSYLPQMWRIARDAHGASAIAYSTWAIWIGANASTMAYAWVNLHDTWLAVVNGINTACCAVICTLTAWKRRDWTRRRLASMRAAERAADRAADTRAAVAPGPGDLDPDDPDAQYSPADSRRR